MIAIGADHGGFALKKELMAHLDKIGVPYKDFGCYDENSVDYPDVARAVGKAVAGGAYEKGVLICGTGIGISMAANKIKGVRAALCGDYFSAKYTRLHNDANVLCMGGRVIGSGLAAEIVDIFLTTEFEGGRHQRRVDQITDLEK